MAKNKLLTDLLAKNLFKAVKEAGGLSAPSSTSAKTIVWSRPGCRTRKAHQRTALKRKRAARSHCRLKPPIQPPARAAEHAASSPTQPTRLARHGPQAGRWPAVGRISPRACRARRRSTLRSTRAHGVAPSTSVGGGSLKTLIGNTTLRALLAGTIGIHLQRAIDGHRPGPVTQARRDTSHEWRLAAMGEMIKFERRKRNPYCVVIVPVCCCGQEGGSLEIAASRV